MMLAVVEAAAAQFFGAPLPVVMTRARRAAGPSRKGGAAEKAFIGFAALPTALFP